MKKLSEIPMDEYIFVYEEEDILMTKNDYLQSHYFSDKNVEIYGTSKVIADTSWFWETAIKQLEIDEYEGWVETVLYEINCNPLLKMATKELNKIFENNPTYCPECKIYNDMEGEKENSKENVMKAEPHICVEVEQEQQRLCLRK